MCHHISQLPFDKRDTLHWESEIMCVHINLLFNWSQRVQYSKRTQLCPTDGVLLCARFWTCANSRFACRSICASEVFLWLCFRSFLCTVHLHIPISAFRTDCTAQYVSSVHCNFDLPANIGSMWQLCICGEASLLTYELYGCRRCAYSCACGTRFDKGRTVQADKNVLFFFSVKFCISLSSINRHLPIS